MQCCLARQQKNIRVFFLILSSKVPVKTKVQRLPPQSFQQSRRKICWSRRHNGGASLVYSAKATFYELCFSFTELLYTEIPIESQGELLMSLLQQLFSPPRHPNVDICCGRLIFLYLFFTSSPESPNCWIINGGNIPFRVNYAWRGSFLYYLLFNSVFDSQQLWLTLSPVLTVRWNPLHPDRRAVWAVIPPSCLHDRRHRKLVVQFCCGPSVSLHPGRSLHLSWRSSGNVSICVRGWGLLRCPLHTPSPWNLLANQNLLGLNKQIANCTKPTFAVCPALLLHFLFWNH